MLLNFIRIAEDVTPTLTLPTDGTQESTYAIARLLMGWVKHIMTFLHISNNETIFIWLYAILVLGIAVLAGTIVQWILVLLLRALDKHINFDFYKDLVKHRYFTKVCRIIPPLVFLILIQFTLYTQESIAKWLTRISWVYVLIQFSISLSTLVECIWIKINTRDNKRNLPLKGIVQVIKIFIWIVTAIIVVAILVNKSPAALLAGIGVFASVLMLIFKDSILGMVAGIQLSENDSLHVGDWIAVPSGFANGTVTEVSLTAVKVTNWDKTVSTVPPYNLITGGFKNYRNMQESNTRRIQRSYLIDADSVVPTTPEMLDEFKKIPLISDWIVKKLEQRDNGKTADVNNPDGLVDGSIDTNLGIFRAYVMLYLNNNVNISHNDTTFVTTLEQTANGIPLQIYCFTATSSWIPYEGIMATIFEHIAVMMYRFRLWVFEGSTGRDTILEGAVANQDLIKNLNGIPFPYFLGGNNPMIPGEIPGNTTSNPS